MYMACVILYCIEILFLEKNCDVAKNSGLKKIKTLKYVNPTKIKKEKYIVVSYSPWEAWSREGLAAPHTPCSGAFLTAHMPRQIHSGRVEIHICRADNFRAFLNIKIRSHVMLTSGSLRLFL